LFTLVFLPMSCLIFTCINCVKWTVKSNLFTLMRLYPCKLFILLLMTSWASFSILLKKDNNNKDHYYAYYFYIVSFILYATCCLINLFNRHFLTRFFAKITDEKHILNNLHYPFFFSIDNAGWQSYFKILFIIVLRNSFNSRLQKLLYI
jgi:hypothetical protein